MLPNEPGHNATVLVALAESGGLPSQTIAGNVRSVPPPAIEFTAPPASAARNTRRKPPGDTRPECIEAPARHAAIQSLRAHERSQPPPNEPVRAWLAPSLVEGVND